MFSGALAPSAAAAALAGLALIDEEGQSRRTQLMANVHYFVGRLRVAGFDVGSSASAIVPVILGDERLAFEMARRCNLEGLYAMPVAYPAVAHGAERLRLNVSCDHRHTDLDFAVDVLMRTRAAIEETTDKHTRLGPAMHKRCCRD